jgi:Protein of unknown function (DUF1353)
MFKSELNLIAIDKRPDLWRFGAPLIWEAAGETITVPAGFITDMASIPHAIDWLPNLDRTGLSRRPAALHDWLYGGDRTRGKGWADDTLRAALLADGMSLIGAFEYWAAVHYCGRPSWDGDNADLRQEHFFTPADFRAYQASLVGSL